MLKNKLFALALCFPSVCLASTVRTSSMNQDLLISETLFNALRLSAKSVPNISATATAAVLLAGNDKLACTSSGCTLEWDTSSPDYPGSASTFEESLYHALSNWANHAQATDPTIHKSFYPDTGSTEIVLSGDPGSPDFVRCTSIFSAGVSAGPSTTITCSLVVSDFSSMVGGADGSDLQAVYNGMLTGQSRIGPQIQALLASFKTSAFLAPADHRNGNGSVQCTHTLYTDLLSDEFVITEDYGYVHPIKNDLGQDLSDGISLTLIGVQDETSGVFTIQQIQSQSYALGDIIHVARAKSLK